MSLIKLTACIFPYNFLIQENDAATDILKSMIEDKCNQIHQKIYSIIHGKTQRLVESGFKNPRGNRK